MTNLGYCCINLTLADEGIKTSRSMIQRTFKAKGIKYASELALENVRDLHKIITWNIQNNVRLYRITSDLFPWETEYQIEDLPDNNKIINKLREIGQLIKLSGIRVSFHPSHFVKLGSERESVIQNSIHNIDHHAKIFDLMELPKTYEYPINIHIGSKGSSKEQTIKRFLNSIDRLSDSARSRLVVENDDKASLYSVKQLCDILDDTPVTFDYFHHTFHTDDVSEEDAFFMAYETWGNHTPLFHYSDSRQQYEDDKSKNTAHADYLYNPINTYDMPVDIDLEAKSKELALFKYWNDFGT